MGNIALRHKNLVNMNAALMASAQGDWVRAEEILRGLVASNPDDFVVSHSLGLLFVRFPHFLSFFLRSGIVPTFEIRPIAPLSSFILGRGLIAVPFRWEAPPLSRSR